MNQHIPWNANEQANTPMLHLYHQTAAEMYTYGAILVLNQASSTKKTYCIYSSLTSELLSPTSHPPLGQKETACGQLSLIPWNPLWFGTLPYPRL